MAPFSEVMSQFPGGRLITWDCFHHGEGKVLFLQEQMLTLDMDLLSLHASSKTTTHAFTEGLIHHQGNDFTTREVWQWVHAH